MTDCSNDCRRGEDADGHEQRDQPVRDSGDDFERAKVFYSAIPAFEMKVMDMGPSRMGMLPFVYGKDHVGGAIVKADDFVPSRQGTIVYLKCGHDLSLVLARIEPAGGELLVGETQIMPEIGYATFLDTEGNEVALHLPQ